MHRALAALACLVVLPLASVAVRASGGSDDTTTTPKPPAGERPPATKEPSTPAAPGTGAPKAPESEHGYKPNEFPASWFWGEGMQRQRQLELTGQPAPELALRDWRGEAQSLAQLKGRVVVVDFWATWCGPCMRAIPENVELVKKHGRDGLIFIGVHDHAKGVNSLDRVIKEKGINYPVAVDSPGADGRGQSAKAYRVGFWPTYVVIDRTGVIRAIGLQPQHVKTVVEKLLKEPAPAQR